MFDRLVQASTRQQMKLLGGVLATYRRGAVTVATDATVVIHRDVEIVVDDGRAVAKKTLIDVLKEEVSSCRAGDIIQTPQGNFVVAEPLSDDGYLMQVVVRQ